MASSDAPIAQTKKAARQEAIAALHKMTPAEMAEESASIARNLKSSGILHGRDTLAIYVHCPKLREVDTTTTLVEVLNRKSKVYVPRVLDKDSNMHFLHITSLNELEEVPPYGIREPLITYSDGRPRADVLEMNDQLELILMPGLAFDAQGKRLGRGGGYYDKFIAQCIERAEEKNWKQPPLLVALAFKAQLFPEVPCDPHDQPVDVLITADGPRFLTERGKEAEKH
jgi:5-formyltetrahydrofolate cyclo-ligase